MKMIPIMMLIFVSYSCDCKAGIELDGMVYTKDRKMFKTCSHDKSGLVRVVEGTESIGSNAFAGCARIETIELPRSIRRIHYGAFAGCTNLTTLIMAENVTNIFVHAFDNCDRLRNLTLPGRASRLLAWYDVTNVTKITIADGSISVAGFGRREKLRHVYIADSVRIIEEGAFQGCTALETIRLPPGLKAIGRWAFAGCTNLNEVVIPSGVELIADSAFADCARLVVKIPKGVTNISGMAFLDLPRGFHSSLVRDNGSCKVVGLDAVAQHWLDNDFKDIEKASQDAFRHLLNNDKVPRMNELKRQKGKMDELLRRYSPESSF